MNKSPKSGGKSGFLERTFSNLRSAWQNIAGAAYDEAAASLQPDLPPDDLVRLVEQMRACLETRGGEVSARARAAALGHAYMALNEIGRGRFLKVMVSDFGVRREGVDEAIEKVRTAIDDGARENAEIALRKVLEPPRVKLLTQFNALPEGVKFLVDMRADLLDLARHEPSLKPLEGDLKDLLKTWFDVDFLELRQINWAESSASVLEKLIAYEAVHAIESWDDLKNRLDSDRRCFAYFHPRMPDEPLIFVEVALVDGLADNVQDLLDENAPVIDPASADTAIFYSISNAQRGLAGISFGNFLIKRVANMLAAEFDGLTTFATLSPVPGFKTWLMKCLADSRGDVLRQAEIQALKALHGVKGDSARKLMEVLERPDWADDPAASSAMRGVLMRLCAEYLLLAKRADDDPRAADPVAHFHLSNGARMERLNWLGDRSAKGLDMSAGIMINYRYKLSEVEANHEAYTSTGKRKASSALRSLLKT